MNPVGSVPSYTPAPLQAPGRTCERVAATKIARGLLQDDRGDQLQLINRGLPELTISHLRMGRIKVGVDPKTGLAYAIKKYRLADLPLAQKRQITPAQASSYVINRLAEEGAAGVAVRSPLAITKLWITNKHVYGQMALMDGDLDGVKSRWSYAQKKRALGAVLVEVERLHAQKQAHCDIKPANIMHRNTPESALLGDFTLVRPMFGDCTPAPGTPYHMAPEQHRAKSQALPLEDWGAADMWAVGATFLDVMSYNPFACDGGAERTARFEAYAKWHHLIQKRGPVAHWRARHVPHAAQFAKAFDVLPMPMRTFLLALCHPDPRQRPTASEARRSIA